MDSVTALTIVAAVAGGGLTWLLYRPPSDKRRATVAIGLAIVALVLTQTALATIQRREARLRYESDRRFKEAVFEALSISELEQGQLTQTLQPSTVAHSAAPATILLLDSSGSMARAPVRRAVHSYLEHNPTRGLSSILTFDSRGARVLPLGNYSEAQLLSEIKHVGFRGTRTDTVGGIRYALGAATALGDSARIILVTDGLDDPGAVQENRAPLAQEEAGRVDLLFLGSQASPVTGSDVRFKSDWRFDESHGLVRVY